MATDDETERTIDRSQFERANGTTKRIRLVVINDDLVTSYPLPARGTLVIGRDKTCNVSIDHALISREHARIVVDDDIVVEDLGSRNGTFVRGDRLAAHTPSPLVVGQLFEVGETACLLQSSHTATRTRRLATHGYFEARLDEACAQSARRSESFCVLRIHIADDVPISSVHAYLAEAELVASYATGELEVLVRDPDVAEQIARRISDGLDARCHVATFPRDGRTADELLEVACRGVLGPTLPGKKRSIVIADPAMRDLYKVVDRIARGTISVLLLGETGTGKEVVADAIHHASPRRHHPFLRLNCAALSDTLLESELFGHERGAFTGATEAKKGLLETADGGTVMLDELGEMPLTTQAKLLRVLEQRQVMRVGGREPIDVDVRFVSATNRDLEDEVLKGTFRRDVYFRLNGAALQVPPLRERPSEIEALSNQFAAETAAELGLDEPPALSPGALEMLIAYGWPGNIRELRNVIARAVLLAPGDQIECEHLPMEKMSLPDDSERSVADQDERQRILDALEKTAGNQTRAAELLGIGRRTLTTKLTKFGIRRPRRNR